MSKATPKGKYQQTNWILKYSFCYKEIWRISRSQGLEGQENFQNLMRSFSDRKKSTKDLAQHLAASSGCQVDPSTVWRSLMRNRLCGRAEAKKHSSFSSMFKYFFYLHPTSFWKILGPVVDNKWDEELEMEEWVPAIFSKTRWRVYPSSRLLFKCCSN